MNRSILSHQRDSNFMHMDGGESRILSQEETKKILDEAISYIVKRGNTNIVISSWWGGGQRWSRNLPTMNSDQREVSVRIIRSINGGEGQCETNQVDSVSLRGAIKLAEKYAIDNAENRPLDPQMEEAKWSYKGSNVWSDKTFNQTVTDNARVVRDITQKSIEDGLTSAGYIGNSGSSAVSYTLDSWGRDSFDWGLVTEANCSITVRHPKGIGSGWAGKSSFDVSRWKIEDIANRAYEKCKLSLNPVRLEPGRYVSILEPQAVSTLTGYLIHSLVRMQPESGINKQSPIYNRFDGDVRRHVTKLGVQLVDARLNIYHDPEDPLVGTHRSANIRRVDLIKNGVLTALYNNLEHEIVESHSNDPSIRRASYRIDGTDTSVEDMIKSTRRGLLVSRLEQPYLIDSSSLQLTGVTRDGLWLIENGSITKAVKNFRWTESPLFALNNVEEIGIPEPVFVKLWSRSPLSFNFHDSLHNVVVPPMKIKDFHFSSMIDAI